MVIDVVIQADGSHTDSRRGSGNEEKQAGGESVHSLTTTHAGLARKL
jgi:hypothetical protein